MVTFSRSFLGFEALKAWNAANHGNAVEALFERWALPGEASTDDRPLRLGLRNGYLNFYVKGQSVGKLSCGAGGPSLEVHNAYVTDRKTMPVGDATKTQNYIRFGANALAERETAALIREWVQRAKEYTSPEKSFIDDLVGANSGIIDLEMGLPAGILSDGKRVAPRMDIVTVQFLDLGPPTIVFWEAKCANNAELRSSKIYQKFKNGKFLGPKVINQLQKYELWMGQDGNIAKVGEAYRETGAVLLKLYSLFRRGDSREPKCVAGWQALANNEKPSVIAQPGLVIGNYVPEGFCKKISSKRMPHCASTFASKDHREELERHGITIYEVGPTHGARVLPALSD